MRKTTDIRKVHNAQDLIGYFAGNHLTVATH